MIHTVKFNKPVYFDDHTGVTFENVTTGETVLNAQISSATVSPSDVISYEVTWISDPVAGETVVWHYSGGTYKDYQLGGEILSNGELQTDLSDWVNDNTYWQWDAGNSGQAHHPLGSAFNKLTQVDVMTPGVFYRCAINIDVLSSPGDFRVQARTNPDGPGAILWTSSVSTRGLGVYDESFDFTAGAGEVSLCVARTNTGVNTEGYLRSLSLKEVTAVELEDSDLTLTNCLGGAYIIGGVAGYNLDPNKVLVDFNIPVDGATDGSDLTIRRTNNTPADLTPTAAVFDTDLQDVELTVTETIVNGDTFEVSYDGAGVLAKVGALVEVTVNGDTGFDSALGVVWNSVSGGAISGSQLTLDSGEIVNQNCDTTTGNPLTAGTYEATIDVDTASTNLQIICNGTSVHDYGNIATGQTVVPITIASSGNNLLALSAALAGGTHIINSFSLTKLEGEQTALPAHTEVDLTNDLTPLAHSLGVRTGLGGNDGE